MKLAGHTGQGDVSVTGPLEILRVAAAPFPGIAQVEHGLHIPFAQLDEKIVQPPEQGVVVLARSILERRLHFGIYAALSVGAHQHAQVAHSHRAQAVQLAGQTLPVASAAFRGQYRPVPEVGTYKVIRLFVFDELTVLYPDDVMASSVHAGENHHCGQDGQHGYSGSCGRFPDPACP